MHEQTKTGGQDDDTTKDTAVQSKVPLNTCRAEQPAATRLLTHHFDDLCVCWMGDWLGRRQTPDRLQVKIMRNPKPSKTTVLKTHRELPSSR